jgi:hypothetical protein
LLNYALAWLNEFSYCLILTEFFELRLNVFVAHILKETGWVWKAFNFGSIHIVQWCVVGIQTKALVCTKRYLLCLKWQPWLNPYFVRNLYVPKYHKKDWSQSLACSTVLTEQRLTFLRLCWIFLIYLLPCSFFIVRTKENVLVGCAQIFLVVLYP